MQTILLEKLCFILTYEPPHGKTNNLPRRKQTICLGENKGQILRSYCEADQHLCFRYSDSTVPLLLKSEISSLELFSVTVQVSLCRTWWETTLLVFPQGGSYICEQKLSSISVHEEIDCTARMYLWQRTFLHVDLDFEMPEHR